jgi:hypothetical protein
MVELDLGSGSRALVALNDKTIYELADYVNASNDPRSTSPRFRLKLDQVRELRCIFGTQSDFIDTIDYLKFRGIQDPMTIYTLLIGLNKQSMDKLSSRYVQTALNHNGNGHRNGLEAHV